MARRRPQTRPAGGSGGLENEGSERHPVLGAVDLALGLLLLAGIWGALPARWWPGDLLGTVVALSWIASGTMLLRGTGGARRVGRVAAAAVLVVGVLTCTAVAWTAAYLAGLYGPVGGGGAIILGVVAALLFPYLVLLPAAQLWLLAPRAPDR